MSDERVALVTGATRGIGRTVAETLTAQGHALCLHGRTREGAEAAAVELGPNHLAVYGDIADATAVTAIMRTVHERHRRLDALVVNAGVHEAGLLGMMPAAAVERLFAVNAAGAVHTLQASVRLLRRGTGPSVVLISSVMGTTGAAGQAVYSATKAAVAGLARAAAKELGPAGIRVNAVAPGFIDTDLLASLDEQGRAGRIRDTPLGRLGTPQDVAETVAFLLSERAGFITGQVIGVDGGLVI